MRKFIIINLETSNEEDIEVFIEIRTWKDLEVGEIVIIRIKEKEINLGKVRVGKIIKTITQKGANFEKNWE